MKFQEAASDVVEYAALSAPSATAEVLLLRGVLFGALLVFVILLARVVLRRRGARISPPQPLDLSFLREWMATQGSTVNRANAERMTDWLEQPESKSCDASATARRQLTALLQIPRYGGPAADTAPIQVVIEGWLQASEPVASEA